ncbi:MAG: magnesium chelatase family protein [Solirubrobacterales bacterium]|jgi:magnesium chelatase family protein|nr:magnesium chelatase family protein [Solirubrobacterales bacterium]
MFAIARTFALIGVAAEPVHVEVDIGSGLPSFTIVGLPDAAVRESRERVRSALVNSGFKYPQHRITANLAPADLRKAGPGFDLAIAAALLVASGQLPRGVLDRYALAGELALDGAIRPVPGALAMAEGARGWGMRGVAVAPGDASQAALVSGLEVVSVDHVARLRELGEGSIEPVPPAPAPDPPDEDLPDLEDLRGHPALRRCLEIAAAGAHSLLLVGPPGGGKTLALQRLPSLLPPLSRNEVIEVTRIAGVCGENGGPRLRRPFRAPHHTVSGRALVGGGAPPRPGEVTRAHRGVLFLDELGEFRRDALEALRVPLEEGVVTITRTTGTVSLPCRFMLVAASNPCPCGHGPDSGECECHPGAVSRYMAKLSGALADRIDITMTVEPPPAEELTDEETEGSSAVRDRVVLARRAQEDRLGPGRTNTDMTPSELRRHCNLGPAARETLERGHRKLSMSARGWDRCLRLARTIADLGGEERISVDHISEAIEKRRRGDP